jgi:hypothetical protein
VSILETGRKSLVWSLKSFLGATTKMRRMIRSTRDAKSHKTGLCLIPLLLLRVLRIWYSSILWLKRFEACLVVYFSVGRASLDFCASTFHLYSLPWLSEHAVSFDPRSSRNLEFCHRSFPAINTNQISNFRSQTIISTTASQPSRTFRVSLVYLALRTQPATSSRTSTSEILKVIADVPPKNLFALE